MTMLIRFVDDYALWLDLGMAGADAGELPIWAIRDFLPSKRDGSGLSVYEVEDEDEALLIAGAFAFQEQKMDGGSTSFMAAERAAVEGAGISIAVTPSKLGNSFADPKHRDLHIDDMNAVNRVVRAFLNGQPLHFEGKVVGQAARSSARSNHISYSKLSDMSFATNWRAKNLLTFIKEKVVDVQGNPLRTAKAASATPIANSPSAAAPKQSSVAPEVAVSGAEPPSPEPSKLPSAPHTAAQSGSSLPEQAAPSVVPALQEGGPDPETVPSPPNER